MMRFSKQGTCWASMIVALAFLGAFSEGNDTALVASQPTDSSSLMAWTKKVDISGYGAIEGGEIEDGHYARLTSSPEIQHIWLGHTYAGLSVRGTVNRYFSVLVSLEGRLWYTTPLAMQRDYTTWGAPGQNFDLAIPNAEGILTFGQKKTWELTLNMGRFEYKYNPQAQDLGEYLFRTGCYPAYIQTTFDLPLARVSGIRLSLNLFDFLRQDLLVTTMTDVRPFYDFSLTYLVGANVVKVFDGSIGIQFDHLFSADQNETSPKGNYSVFGYLKAPGDTAYYTFAGTKLMFRLAFDPKRFFHNAYGTVSNITGETGGVFYAEAAVLGLENYPKSNAIDTANTTSNVYGYDDLFQKMPVMFGFNWPTHPIASYGLIPIGIALCNWDNFQRHQVLYGGAGLLSGLVAGGGTWLLEKYVKANVRLDVLSVEAEWFGARYPDSYGPDLNLTPVPASPPADGTSGDYTRDNWKWAIYAKKTIFGGLSLIGLVGRDHLRTETYIKKDQDYEETLIKNNQWYWMFKIKGSF
jgi:hypothetical protein